MSWARHLLKVLVFLLLSPCLLCLGSGVYIWIHSALRERGISMGNSVWMPLGPRLEQRDLPNHFYVGAHSAFFTREWGDHSALWRIGPHWTRREASFQGALLTLTSAEGVWFGLVSKPSPDGPRDARIFQIIRSLDEGDRWEERGHTSELSSLLAVSPEEVWGLGEELQVSTDGGLTFSSVSLPGARPLFQGRLARGADGTVWWLGPEGLFRLSDQGRSWTHEPLREAEPQAGDGGVLAARVGAGLAIRRDSPGEPWRVFTALPHRVSALAVVGDTVRVVTHPNDPFKDGWDAWYHHSEDGGRTWEHTNTELTPHIALHGREWGVGRELLGQLYGRLPGG